MDKSEQNRPRYPLDSDLGPFGPESHECRLCGRSCAEKSGKITAVRPLGIINQNASRAKKIQHG